MLEGGASPAPTKARCDLWPRSARELRCPLTFAVGGCRQGRRRYFAAMINVCGAGGIACDVTFEKPALRSIDSYSRYV